MVVQDSGEPWNESQCCALWVAWKTRISHTVLRGPSYAVKHLNMAKEKSSRRAKCLNRWLNLQTEGKSLDYLGLEGKIINFQEENNYRTLTLEKNEIQHP